MILSDLYLKKYWNKVNVGGDNECWNWNGRIFNSIPMFSYSSSGKKFNIRADALSFMIKNNVYLGKGYKIKKTCDNNLCCNPLHIYTWCNNSLLDEGFIQKFWEKVDIRTHDECWMWTAYKNQDGYGVCKVKIDKKWKTMLSHRVSYFITFGFFVCGENRCLHSCDNPSCVNPNHLFVGTQKDNIEDMYKKNRQTILYGIRSGMAKLNDEKVHEIKKMLSEMVPIDEIAKKFGVTKNNISSIKTGKTWRRVMYNE